MKKATNQYDEIFIFVYRQRNEKHKQRNGCSKNTVQLLDTTKFVSNNSTVLFNISAVFLKYFTEYVNRSFGFTARIQLNKYHINFIFAGISRFDTKNLLDTRIM